jgi:hypothetical protein
MKRTGGASVACLVLASQDSIQAQPPANGSSPVEKIYKMTWTSGATGETKTMNAGTALPNSLTAAQKEALLKKLSESMTAATLTFPNKVINYHTVRFYESTGPIQRGPTPPPADKAPEVTFGAVTGPTAPPAGQTVPAGAGWYSMVCTITVKPNSSYWIIFPYTGSKVSERQSPP